MDKIREFTHRFEEDTEAPQLSIDVDVTDRQHIHINVEEGGNVWLSANREGWLHLARICAEMGTMDFKPGFHFHMTFDFQGSNGSGQEISFEVAENP
ncbi:MAG: hypothetical protein V4671_23750 [Armatimonadota bacterium]